MANHPSAEKRNRQRIRRTERNERNRAAISSVRTLVKKARAAIAAGDKTKAKSSVDAASTALAKAAQRGALHIKAASRTTARIQSALAKLG
jgi:small subunit ribosomal protein S20